MGTIEKLGLKADSSLTVVVLTGAGVSAESGVPVFRGPGSLWDIPEARKLAADAGPPWNTEGTWKFYEWRRQLVSRCEPNAAHLTIAEMERYFKDFTLVTQNVDGLHQRAGSKRVFELHGSMWRARCLRCRAIVELPETPLPSLPPVHWCGSPMRPHVVQFGEPVDQLALREALDASSRAELFLVVGTSGVVFPAAELPLLALERGAKVVEINPTETALTPHVTMSIHGNAGEALPKFWHEFLGLRCTNETV
jgi:NAD-dependent deacetylase